MNRAIKRLLDEQFNSVRWVNTVPHNYVTLREYILQKELRRELDALQTMLLNPETFAEEFRKRCEWRATDTENTVPFSELPDSLTNQLYWNIATLVFNPQNLQEMLAIVLPQVKIHLQVSFPEIPVDSLRHKKFTQRIEVIPPRLVQVDELDTLNDPPSIEALTHYIISDEMILNLSDIENFMLNQHSILHQLLSQKYPELHKKMITHNFAFEELEADINILNNNGMTPKDAIERLISGLRLGGSSMTGTSFAGKAADDAIKQFFNYFKSLPVELRMSLLALTYSGSTLGLIISQQLERGSCVESAASVLSCLLQNNQGNIILNSLPRMNTDSLKQLVNKYRTSTNNKSLDTRKAGFIVPVFPANLTKEIIRTIAPSSSEDLVLLLANFPVEFYELFWECSTLSTSSEQLSVLADYIGKDLFSDEQKRALAKAIYHYFQRNNTNYYSINYWAEKTSDPIILQEILACLPEAQRIMLFNSSQILRNACHNPSYLKKVLELLPIHYRFDVIKAVYNSHSTILHEIADDDVILLGVLGLLPEAQRLALIKLEKLYTDSFLFSVVQQPALLSSVFELLLKNDRLEAVKLTQSNGTSIMHYAAEDLNRLKSLLAFFPEEQWGELTYAVNHDQQTPLFFAVKNPESLAFLLKIYVENQRRNEFIKFDFMNNTLLHAAAKYEESLKIVLECYPEAKRPHVISLENNDNQTAVHLAASNPKSLRLVLDVLNEPEKQLSAIRMADHAQQNVLHYAALNPESIKILQTIYPEDEWFDAIQTLDEEKNTVLHLAAPNAAALKILLPAFATEKQRTVAISRINKYGDTVLHLTATNPESLKILLASYPEEQRLALLTQENIDGKTALEIASGNSECLKVLFKSLQEKQVLTAVLKLKKNNETIIRSNIGDTKKLINILNALTVEQRVSVVAEYDKAGKTLLEAAVRYPASFKAILDLLPEKERNELISSDWSEVLDLVANSPDLLKMVLKLLPLEQRMELLESERFNDAQIKNLIPLIIGEIEHFGGLGWFLRKAASTGDVFLVRTLLDTYPIRNNWSVIFEKDKNNKSFLDKVVTLRYFNVANLLDYIDKESILQGNEEMSPKARALYKSMNKLYQHGLILDKASNYWGPSEGKKAIYFALKLEYLANNFIKAKNSADRAKMQEIQQEFTAQLNQGHHEMGVHRESWKPIWANILIAATGIGLIAIIGKIIVTGSAFFAQTERQNRINEINHSFSLDLLREESNPEVMALA